VIPVGGPRGYRDMVMPLPRIHGRIHGIPSITAWPRSWEPLRALFDATVRAVGLEPCLPDRELLASRIAQHGDAAAYAARCRESPLIRLGLLDLVPRPCAYGWSGDRARLVDFEQRALPRLTRQRLAERPVARAWVMAACRGEDAWRVALALHRALPASERWDASVLATDFSLAAITAAQVGRYTSEDSSLKAEERRHLFLRQRGGGWAARLELRRLVHFAWLDPAEEWPVAGPFEAIFTGDLLRLLAPGVRATVLTRLSRLLRRRGTLYCARDDDFPELAAKFPRLRAPGIRAK
jgi:chemotaxis methyl-accepting protein methylase